MTETTATLVARALDGDRRAIAKLLSLVETGDERDGSGQGTAAGPNHQHTLSGLRSDHRERRLMRRRPFSEPLHQEPWNPNDIVLRRE
jgi:hypothetical protein